MSRILFIDPVCPDPYQARTLFDRALGATEATAVRVAEGLAQRGHRVTVAQCGRTWPSRSPGGVAYVPFDYGGSWRHLPRAEAVVVLRQHKVLRRVRERFPEARLALWLHGVPGSKRRALGPAAAAVGATVVCASDAHRAAVGEALEAAGAWARTARIHPPVDDALVPDATPVDPDTLVAVSGGGLGEVLRAFGHVRERRPSARLVVAGAVPDPPAGVVPLGAVPHREVVRHVRQAFAVFCPQAGVPDVSGLAVAEANAVGTPVLAHPHAAVREAVGERVGDGRQLVDARDPAAAARRLGRWWDEGRPEVRAPRRFRTATVVGGWERLLGATAPRRHALRVAA